MAKHLFMIAGPNGAGKTTTAYHLSPELKKYDFLNADEIAKGIAPLHPERVPVQASKIMIKRFQDLLNSNESFAFETTGSGKNYIKYLEQARKKKYKIHLLFLWLPTVSLAIERVEQRVRQGGHNIPEKTIRNRYILGLRNLFTYYLDLADTVVILNNGNSSSQKVIAMKENKYNLVIKNKSMWKEMQEIAKCQN